MVIDIHCYNCQKSWKAEIISDATCVLIGFEFCGTCKKKMMRNFEMQFMKLISLPRIRLEE